MNEEKTSITDYGIFDNAVSTTNSLIKAVNSARSVLEQCKGVLGGNSIFEGPICDECIRAFGNIDSRISGIINNCNNVTDYLIKASNDYDSTDTDSSSNTQAVGSKNVV